MAVMGQRLGLSSNVFPEHKQGAELEVGQLGCDLVHTRDVRVTGRLACCATMIISQLNLSLAFGLGLLNFRNLPRKHTTFFYFSAVIFIIPVFDISP